MSSNNSRGARSAMNVTPLIDILLVLLIIFMVIQPDVQRGLGTSIPRPPELRTAQPDPHTVVISVQGTSTGPSYALNDQALTGTELRRALKRVAELEERSVVFVQGSAALDYGAVSSVFDIAHGVGIQQVGVLTPASAPR